MDEIKRNMEVAEVFQPGDGACLKNCPGIKFLVTRVSPDQTGICVMYKDGTHGWYPNTDIRRTGERYPRLIELLDELPE